MEGITVLETQPFYEANLFGFCILVFGLLTMVIGALLIIDFNYDMAAPFLLFISSFIIILGFSIIIIPTPSSDKAIYTVKIEEKVDLNEFLNKYEIIEHEKYSNIYKVKGDIINND